MTHDLHQNDARREHWEEGYLHTRRSLGRRRRRIRSFVDAPRSELLLELGCGDGLNLRVAEEIGFRRLAGMDYSAALVAQIDRYPTLVGDGHSLPLAGDCLPTLFIDSVLHHLTDFDAAASEIARVLRPGGRLYYFEPRPGVLRSLLDWFTMSRVGALLPFFGPRQQTLREEWDLYQNWLAHHSDMRSKLLENGLRLRYRKAGPIGMFLCFEKAADVKQSQ